MSLCSEVMRNYYTLQRDHSEELGLRSSSAVAISLGINMLLPLLDLLAKLNLLTQELLKFIEVVHHFHRIFAAAVSFVMSLKSYTPTGSNFFLLSVSS